MDESAGRRSRTEYKGTYEAHRFTALDEMFWALSACAKVALKAINSLATDILICWLLAGSRTSEKELFGGKSPIPEIPFGNNRQIVLYIY